MDLMQLLYMTFRKQVVQLFLIYNFVTQANIDFFEKFKI